VLCRDWGQNVIAEGIASSISVKSSSYAVDPGGGTSPRATGAREKPDLNELERITFVVSATYVRPPAVQPRVNVFL